MYYGVIYKRTRVGSLHEISRTRLNGPGSYKQAVEPEDLGDRQWCEYAVPNFLPTLRAKIADTLAQSHGMSQREIANRLGLSQAAVSHYTTARRGNGRRFHENPHLELYADKLAERVAGGLSGPRLTAAICGLCTSIREGEQVNPCLCIYSGVSRPEFLETFGPPATFPRQPCETFVVRRLLPAVRAELSRTLTQRRAQTEVAALVGVSQPAVSQYVANKRGEDPLLTHHPDLGERVRGLAERFEAGVSPEERREALCGVCVEARRHIQEPVPAG